MNVDQEGDKADVHADAGKLPFPDEYADYVCAIHIIEHFYRWEVPEVLAEWKRVLKPGGRIVLELPCMDKIYLYIAQTIYEQKKLLERMTVMAFWGDPRQKSEAAHHRWGYTIAEMQGILMKVGFRNVEYQNPRYHHMLRDMRFEAVK